MLSKNDSLSLIGFVPALVVQYLMSKQSHTPLPDKQGFMSVVMFADISGFTNLTETLSKIGPEGAELIAFAINRYMELLVSAINKSGGDIFKFAGDAMIVVWPPSNNTNRLEQYEEVKITCRQALQSALDIQTKLDNTTILEDIKLSVKIGFGIGDINIIYVGGVFGRSEYLATGDPLTQAFKSEHQATAGGQIIVSQQVYDMVQDYFIFETDDTLHHGFHRVTKLVSKFKVKFKADALLIKNKIGNLNSIKSRIMMYVPAALLPYIELEQEKWSSELRRITVLFINLGIDLSDASSEEGLKRIQTVIQIVQKCVYMHEGSVNKLLMDDKGSTLIVCFGLPPLMHQDDPCRALLASQLLVEQLERVNCKCSIGISTGLVFTGVVGTSGSRREYSVLGDSVNLAARMMQAALMNKKSVLCCQETARDSQHKVICQFWKDLEMKGKTGFIPAYEINDNGLPVLRTHYHTIPGRSNEFQTFERLTMSQDYQGIVGVRDTVQNIMELITLFLKQDSEGVSLQDLDTERDFIYIKGGYGVGKSFLMRCIMMQIREEQLQTYKYEEHVTIIEVSLNSLDRTFKMNGFRKVAYQLYQLIIARRTHTPSEIFQIVTSNNNQIITLFEEIFQLSYKDLVADFPPQVEPFNKLYDKLVGQAIIKLFELYFEIKLPTKEKQFHRQHSSSLDMQEGNENNSSNGELSMQQSSDLSFDNQFKSQGINVSPLLLCLDDFQYFDSLSMYMIKTIVKKFSRALVIGIGRDQFWEIPIQSRKESTIPPNKGQESIFYNGLDSIMKSYNVNLKEIVLKGFQLSKLKLFQKRFFNMYFGFESFVPEDPKLINKLVVNQDILDPLIFEQNKQQLMNLDYSQCVSYYLHLKTNGQPLLLINLINNLIQSAYLVINYETQHALVSSEFHQILMHDQWLQVPAPLAAIQMNSPIIDSLSCLNLLLLKFASVLGDIFDIQTLFKIIPFKQVNQLRLLQALKGLVGRDIIEFMNGDSDNRYYRFVRPFMREVLYQRMTYSQRRQIHALVAETMQLIPQPYEYDDWKDFRKLEYHWRIAEMKVSVKQANIPVKFSHKAKKSLIVKQIQMILAGNNDIKTPLKTGYFYKRSDRGVSWQYRFGVVDSIEFKLFQSDEQRVLTCLLPLKQISSIQSLFIESKQADTPQYCLKVQISNWYKFGQEQAKRSFCFAFMTEDEMEEWAIYLEFAKAKAIYTDFVQDFGKISFPINLQVEAYDSQLSMQLRDLYKTSKIKQQQTLSPYKKSNSNVYTPPTTKWIAPPPNNSTISPVAGKRFSVRFSVSSEQDERLEYMQLKERTREFINKSMLALIIHLLTHTDESNYLHLGQCGKYMRKYQKLFHSSPLKVSSLVDFQLQ